MQSTRRGSFSVHRSEKTPGSKYSSTSGLSPRGERQAEFHASTHVIEKAHDIVNFYIHDSEYFLFLGCKVTKTRPRHQTIADIRDFPVTKKQKSYRRLLRVGDNPELAKAACFLALNAQNIGFNH